MPTCVWEAQTTANQLIEGAHIISQKSSHSETDTFRILSDTRPTSHALQVQANLEDAYLYWVRQREKTWVDYISYLKSS